MARRMVCSGGMFCDADQYHYRSPSKGQQGKQGQQGQQGQGQGQMGAPSPSASSPLSSNVSSPRRLQLLTCSDDHFLGHTVSECACVYVTVLECTFGCKRGCVLVHAWACISAANARCVLFCIRQLQLRWHVGLWICAACSIGTQAEVEAASTIVNHSHLELTKADCLWRANKNTKHNGPRTHTHTHNHIALAHSPSAHCQRCPQLHLQLAAHPTPKSKPKLKLKFKLQISNAPPVI